MYKKFLFIVFLLIVQNSWGQALAPILEMNNGLTDTTLTPHLRFCIDSTNTLTINKVAVPAFQHHFNLLSTDILLNDTIVYWAKFTLKWNASTSFMLNTSDVYKWIELYLPNGHGGFDSTASGIEKQYFEKDYRTTLHLFALDHQSEGSEIAYFLKLKMYNGYRPINIERQEFFVNDWIYRYFFHGILFGVILVAAFYNFILFIKLREYAYLYYSLYVLCFALFGSMIWYYQFNFLWWLHLTHTDIMDLYNIPYTLITIFFLLYAKSFFYIKNRNSRLDQYFLYLIACRVLCYFIGKFLFVEFRSPWIDSLIISPVFYIAFVTYKKRFQPAKNFLIAFSLLYLGMLTHSLMINVTDTNLYLDEKTVFVLCGCSGMFLFSLSLGDRLQLLGEEKDRVKNDLIHQLKKNENYKDQLTLSLEQKVSERTKEIEERNKQLDTFVYRASHDIKGPLKSMLGLAQLGLMETHEEVSKGYFEHILKSSKRLDATLADLLNVVKMNHTIIEKTRVDFNFMLFEILSSFEHHPNFKKIKFDFQIAKILYYESDKRLIYSVLQNLIENGINYSDLEKTNSFITIQIEPFQEGIKINYEDNGLGIDEKYQEKIFEMFFKINANSTGTGLGMYIVKTTIERLGGTISIQSNEGIGTSFTILLK